MPKLWSVSITAACLLGCGSGGATSSFQVKGIVAALTTAQRCSDGNVTALLALGFSTAYDTAFLSDPDTACVLRANDSSYWVFLRANGPDPAPFAPGSYEIPSEEAAGFVMHLDAECRQVLPNVVATSGTLQLTTVSSDRIAGRVDLVFPDGRTAGDAFDAPVISMATNPCAMLGSGGIGNAPGFRCFRTACDT